MVILLTILGISILLQLTAAFLALRLIAVTGRRRAWILIAVATILMAIRRLITFYRVLSGYSTQPVDLVEESVTLLISVSILVGIAWIGPVFNAIRTSEVSAQQSEERFRSLFENTSIGFYRTTPDGKILLANPALVHMLGYKTFEDLAQRNLEEQGFEPHYPRSEFRRRVEQEKALVGIESAWQKTDDTIIYVRESARVVYDENGKVLYYEGTIEDITERKQIEAALRENEAYIKAVMDNLPLGIAVNSVDPNVTFEYMNDNFPAIYRTTREALSNPDAFWESVYENPKFREEIKKRVLEDCASGDPERMHWENVPIERAGAETTFVDAMNTPVPGKSLAISTVWDVTERKKAEEAVKKSEELFRNTFEQAAVGISILSPGADWIQVNQRLCNILGYSREELTKLNYQDITHPDHRESDAERVRQIVAGKRDSDAWEKRYVRKDGRVIWARLTTSLFRSQDGQPKYFITVTEDITERKQAEETIHDLARFPTENPNPVLRIATDGSLLFGNQAALSQLKQWKLKVGETVPEVLMSQVREVIKTRKEAIREIACGKRTFSISVSPAPTGEDVNLYARDVTERVQAEQKVRKLNQELEMRVRDRTAQLEAANKELEAFSYSVSHDLRAPLRALDGFSAALQTNYPDKLDEQGRHYLERIRDAAQRMGQLIEDLLGLSRLTRAELVRQRVDLSALVEEIADEIQQRDAQRQVEFIISPRMYVQADPHLLRTVMQNLLDNSWKFTGPRSPAHIKVGVVKQDGEQVYFVRDDGVGFDASFSDKLFVPFQRLHSTSEFPGTGIGLANVQRIITRHGGRVWAESTVDYGATFFFTLGGTL